VAVIGYTNTTVNRLIRKICNITSEMQQYNDEVSVNGGALRRNGWALYNSTTLGRLTKGHYTSGGSRRGAVGAIVGDVAQW